MFRLTATPRVARSVGSLFTPLTTSARNASTLVVCQHKDGEYDASLLHTVTAAKKLGGEVSVLVAGKDASSVASNVSKLGDVNKVFLCNHDSFERPVAENMTSLIAALQGKSKFSHILLSATMEGKNIMPRAAVKVDGAAISEVLGINSETEFVRPMYAGNAIATVNSEHSPVLMTVRGTAFEKAALGDADESKIEKFDFSGKAEERVKVTDEKVQKSDRPEITAAETVIAGGRALKSAENFDILYKFADTFKKGAAVGASRAAVDAGYAPNDMQIGQTGKVCAPPLYFAVGISGAIQHLAGMKDSKCIVAINTDEEAPIFQVSDYGLKADLFEAIPELTEKLSK